MKTFGVPCRHAIIVHSSSIVIYNHDTFSQLIEPENNHCGTIDGKRPKLSHQKKPLDWLCVCVCLSLCLYYIACKKEPIRPSHIITYIRLYSVGPIYLSLFFLCISLIPIPSSPYHKLNLYYIIVITIILKLLLYFFVF